ncbi:MAG: carboxypeptidase-like regulatory domain-containing protein [Bacteroides sp.]|nr:carboxypeptidase-like regulatory domain-containing protein [Bacteroides sp.]
MGLFFVYILKSAACLAVFYLFYRLLLARETFHRFNRFALLGILLLSCLLPLAEVSVEQESEVHQTMLTLEQLLLMADAAEDAENTATVSGTVIVTWVQVALLAYLAGILFFALRHLYSLAQLLSLLRSGRKEDLGRYLPGCEERVTLMVHRRDIAPFSWMGYIVIAQADLQENGREILIHELAHIRNRHSWDLLVADVCIFLQWFNPASWLLKQELQNIHEFEADETVIGEGVDARQYQLLLIKKAVGTRLYSMANSFNHSKLKKRITMMLKEKSSPWARLKYLYVLPVAAVAVTAFARPEVSGKVEKISAVKVNDLAAIVETKAMESVGDTTKPAELKIIGVRTQKKQEGKKAADALAEEQEENAPLYIVDGREVTSAVMSALDPHKIEGVTVLKDKTATELYGEKGKNGVLLLSLKGSKQTPITLSTKGSGVSAPGVGGVYLHNRRAEWADVDVFVDGEKIELQGKLVEVVSPDQIEGIRVEKSAEGAGRGKIYITTKNSPTTPTTDAAQENTPLSIVSVSTYQKPEADSGKGEIKVEGVVLDTDEKPVVGATVLLEGTKKGTVTDREGRFTMPAAKGDKLVISYISMKTAKVKASSKVTITLKDE